MSEIFKYRTDIHTIETNVPNSQPTLITQIVEWMLRKFQYCITNTQINWCYKISHPRAEVTSNLEISHLVNLKSDSTESTLVSTIDGVGTIVLHLTLPN